MKKAYVILVVALCCLPMLLFPIAGEKTSAEKRYFPEISNIKT